MLNLHILLGTALTYLLVLAPVVGFIYFGWSRRRSDIERGFSASAIVAYFKAFHHRGIDQSKNAFGEYDNYYKEQYGRRRYYVPLALYAGVSGLLLCWCGLSVEGLLSPESLTIKPLPIVAVLAVVGAVMWIVYESIERWYTCRLSASDIYMWTLRLVVAIPTAYAMKSLVTDAIAPAIAFFIGAFPTTQLFTIFRRVASKKLDLGDSNSTAISELQKLQGIDTRVAERFADEGITTIMQLAYCDPIQVTIRTGYSFSHINDWICQALLWLYLEDEKPLMAKWGLRGAYEMRSLWSEYHDEDAKVREPAATLVREIASAIKRPEVAFLNVLEQVARDPYTEFLYLSWAGNSPNE